MSGRMTLGRLLLPVTLVLLALLLLGSLAPDPDKATKDTLQGGAPIEAAGGTVEGRLPADRVVRARVGDLVRVEVRSERGGSAEIRQLGLVEVLSPDSPAVFEFLAEDDARYPVRLVETGERLGTIDVRPAR